MVALGQQQMRVVVHRRPRPARRAAHPTPLSSRPGRSGGGSVTSPVSPLSAQRRQDRHIQPGASSYRLAPMNTRCPQRATYTP